MLVEYLGVVIFQMTIKQIKDDFNMDESEIAVMLTIMNIGAIFGLVFAMLGDIIGRTIMFNLSNGINVIVVLLISLNTVKEYHYALCFMIRFATQALMVINTVYTQETIRSDLRYTVFGILFVLDGVGLLSLMCLNKYLENWRLVFSMMVSLGLLSMVLRIFASESYMWLVSVNRPDDAMNSLNYCCEMQSEPFQVVYLDQEQLFTNYGIVYVKIGKDYIKKNVKEFNQVNSEYNLISNTNLESNYNEILRKDLEKPTKSYFENMISAFETNSPIYLHLVFMMIYALFSTTTFHVMIAYINNYHINIMNNIEQLEFGNVSIFASILMIVYSILLIALFTLFNKRILLLVIHSHALINVLLLIYSFKEIIQESYLINLGLILGSGRLIKILNGCLIAEASYSSTRSTIASIFMVIESGSELNMNAIMILVYDLYPLVSLSALAGWYSFAAVMASFMVAFHWKNSEELPV
eukprot:Mrub_02893.p1 GENE.Mrub_02893~~Mrub_02893.p1  ORF type:complete len:518 (-),score=11.04 Mrub_02893:32-1435(-)